MNKTPALSDGQGGHFIYIAVLFLGGLHVDVLRVGQGLAQDLLRRLRRGLDEVDRPGRRVA